MKQTCTVNLVYILWSTLFSKELSLLYFLEMLKYLDILINVISILWNIVTCILILQSILTELFHFIKVLVLPWRIHFLVKRIIWKVIISLWTSPLVQTWAHRVFLNYQWLCIRVPYNRSCVDVRHLNYTFVLSIVLDWPIF